MIVELYIFQEGTKTVSLPLTSDTILLTSDNTIITADATTYQTTLTGRLAKRIELFEDEKISITSSIQNINDISKVFTDYSQSFTIPASENNNEIFKHWYESAIDNGFDQRQRYDGFIKIDTQTFRTGKWQLESASIKNNRVENYKLTFYGDLKSLTDKFGEDKLKDLNTLNEYSINYSGANVLTNIKSTTSQNVMFPFISSNRVWNIGGSGMGTDNINTIGHALNYKELFPAVRVKTIFNAIEDKYNFNFNGSFLNDERFTEAYIWFKNNEFAELNVLGTSRKLDFIGTDFVDTNYFTTNVENDTIKLSTIEPFNEAFVRLEVNFSASVTCQIFLSKNGVISDSSTQTFVGNNFSIDYYIPNSDLGVEYSFFISTSEAVTYTGLISAGSLDVSSFNPYIVPLNQLNGNTLNILDLTKIAPDMKVADFFSGILKTFNLTAFSTDGVNFTLEQLENWYYTGTIKDFTEYCTTDLSIERIKPFKKVNFKYQKSESILNKNFFDFNQREYGDLSYSFENDGGDYSIELPFENILFNRFFDYFQVGYALKSDFNKYIPKPVLLYRYGLKPATYHFDTGIVKTTESFYNAFGQETLYNGFKHSINWGIETSSLDLQLVNNTLFNNYYLAYLNNLYSLKSRMVKVKMRLPYTELLTLKLNDRIVIRNKRYIINQYTTDLTTFESDFELIQDFRSVNFNNSRLIQTDSSAKTLKIDTTSSETLIWSIESDIDSLINGITNYNNYVEVQIKENVSGSQKVAIIESNLNDRIIIRQDA